MDFWPYLLGTSKKCPLRVACGNLLQKLYSQWEPLFGNGAHLLNLSQIDIQYLLNFDQDKSLVPTGFFAHQTCSNTHFCGQSLPFIEIPAEKATFHHHHHCPQCHFEHHGEHEVAKHSTGRPCHLQLVQLGQHEWQYLEDHSGDL